MSLEKLEGEIQEVFILAHQRQYTAQKVIDILKTMFSSREEEELDRQFREKYNTGVVHTAS
jgi:hypothetical protein